MKVLCILASPKDRDESTSKKLAYRFIETYKKNNPMDEVDIIDLYKSNLHFITSDELNKKGELSEDSRVHIFKGYDKYIVASPLWNLSIPGILKSYFDHIAISGVTFKYSKYGMPVGLLKNKKAIYLGTRGGAYPFPLSLMAADRSYIKSIFRFMGVKSFDSYILENIDKKPQKVFGNMERIYKEIYNKAIKF